MYIWNSENRRNRWYNDLIHEEEDEDNDDDGVSSRSRWNVAEYWGEGREENLSILNVRVSCSCA
jgi:hypothetical protein